MDRCPHCTRLTQTEHCHSGQEPNGPWKPNPLHCLQAGSPSTAAKEFHARQGAECSIAIVQAVAALE